MKQVFLVLLSASLLLGACSKSNDDAKPNESTSVEIGGSSYSTVKIGTQTWTSVNYNGAGGKNYDEGANDSKYGKLYTLAEAKAIVLPAGWRLPTWEDYNKLLEASGANSGNSHGVYNGSEAIAKKLMSKSGWDNNIGSDALGFNAFPAGNYQGEYSSKGTAAVFLTSSTFDDLQEPNYSGIPASFVIYSDQEDTRTDEYVTGADFSDYVVEQGDRGSIRFVKDN
ncbi:FISUMP domain-containing protein [Rubrolithibacter danxiaensis]|uniref:FISUMP domain-containing protein n=1 Tax=Rubrolithibacter danxiaensis TaxID=3390805 RepID=UPI003BF83B07